MNAQTLLFTRASESRFLAFHEKNPKVYALLVEYARRAKQRGYKPYDFGAVSGIALNRNWHDESKWFCSELIVAAFEATEHPLLSTRPSSAVYRYTPRDLLTSRELHYIQT